MCHKLPKFIENEPENYADILDYLKTGSGKIIYSSPHSLIVRHESGTHYVSTDGLDRKELYDAIPRHGVLVIDDSDRSFYKENGYLLDKEECYLFSYLKEEVTSSEDGIRLLSQEYKKIVSLNYRGTESDEYTDRAIDEQRIYGLFSDSGELMAFGESPWVLCCFRQLIWRRLFAAGCKLSVRGNLAQRLHWALNPGRCISTSFCPRP